MHLFEAPNAMVVIHMRKWKFLRRATLLVLILVGGELGARTWIGIRATEQAAYPWGYSSPARQATHFRPDPFTGFVLNPAFAEHSDQGFRELNRFPAEHEGPRILALGGSNTYGTQVPLDDTYPRLLERALIEHDDREIEVVNAGVGAYSTANLIGHLALRCLDLKPDVCLFDVGYTDAVVRIRYGGFRPDYTHDYRAWTIPATPLWRRSALLNGIARRLGYPYDFTPSIHDLGQVPFDPDFRANFAASSVEPFRRNLLTLIGICRAHGVRPILCTQAVDFKGHPVGQDDELWIEAMRESNEVVRELAEDKGLLLIDLARELSGKSELFADERRMNAAGNQRRADLVARVLAEGGLIQ